jgi:hypothetical protein
MLTGNNCMFKYLFFFEIFRMMVTPQSSLFSSGCSLKLPSTLSSKKMQMNQVDEFQVAARLGVIQRDSLIEIWNEGSLHSMTPYHNCCYRAKL